MSCGAATLTRFPPDRSPGVGTLCRSAREGGPGTKGRVGEVIGSIRGGR